MQCARDGKRRIIGLGAGRKHIFPPHKSSFLVSPAHGDYGGVYLFPFLLFLHTVRTIFHNFSAFCDATTRRWVPKSVLISAWPHTHAVVTTHTREPKFSSGLRDDDFKSRFCSTHEPGTWERISFRCLPHTSKYLHVQQRAMINFYYISLHLHSIQNGANLFGFLISVLRLLAFFHLFPIFTSSAASQLLHVAAPSQVCLHEGSSP